MTRAIPRRIKPDQLEQSLKQQKVPLQRLILIDQLAHIYAFTNLERAKELLTEQYLILRTLEMPDFLLSFHLNTAIIENQLYNYELAEDHFQKALEILDEIGDVKQQAEVFIDYAGTCMNLGKIDEAVAYLEKARKMLKIFPDERLSARITCREGFMNLQFNNYSKAIELLLDAEKNINTLNRPLELKDYYFLMLVHSGLGKIYEHNDDREKSVKAYLRVVEMCEGKGMRTRLSWHYLNVGIGYMALNNPFNAELYFLKAIKITDDASQLARASAYGNLGYCYLLKRSYRKALELFDRAEQLYAKEDFYNFSILESWRGQLFAERKEPKRALAHYLRALDYAHRIQDFKQLSSVCKDIAELYADLENFKNAYEYQTLHEKFTDQYTEQINKRKQMELEIKYEAEKKQQEAELLRLQATRLQLKALRAQMNPHFMYNALNAIQNYITSHDVTSAAKYLAKFAKLMRQSLDYSDLEIISLEKEIEFLEDYLYINEKLRFEDRLRYEIIVDDELEEDILGVPTMIVQPYVENAIEHGLRTKNEGLIRLSFSLFDEDTILCVVEDNGIGRDKARLLRAQDPQYQNHRSKGTSITEKRLQILHNSKDQQVFVETIDLRDEKSGEALGTRVEIKIPIMEIQIR